MPTDIETANQNKQKIIAAISERGPILPVKVSQDLGISPLLASAFLAELHVEGKLKISNLKVGNSPLYFLPGQEQRLENFIQYLNEKEKEAFSLLKEKKLLEDSRQQPAIRVALKGIRDFAHPIKIKIQDRSVIYWKYHLVTDSEVKALLQGGSN